MDETPVCFSEVLDLNRLGNMEVAATTDIKPIIMFTFNKQLKLNSTIGELQKTVS